MIHCGHCNQPYNGMDYHECPSLITVTSTSPTDEIFTIQGDLVYKNISTSDPYKVKIRYE